MGELCPDDWIPMTGGGLSAPLVIVARLTTGMLGPVASLAPEPTRIVGLPPPVEPVTEETPGLGKPVMLPGWTLEIPLAPVMKKDVDTRVPLTPGAVLGPPLPNI